MSKKIEKRWFKWDKLINNKEYEVVIKEFDKMIENKEKIVIGDLTRRDDALKLMGVISLSPNAMYKRKVKNDKARRVKP